MWRVAGRKVSFAASERKGEANPPAIASVSARADLAWLFTSRIIPYLPRRVALSSGPRSPNATAEFML